MADLAQTLAEHLTKASGQPVRIARVEPLLGGACQDNFLVEGELGGAPKKWVLRSDASGSLPGSLRRRDELRVIEAAVAAGVPTPVARWLAPGLLREGFDAYLLDWADGVAIGAKVLRDPSLADARRGLHDSLAKALAAIHRITPQSAPDLDPPSGLSARDRDPFEAAIEFQRATLARIRPARPALEWALRWLCEHPPRSREVTLVHGDFRTGNYLVTERGLSAILDWEFAHFGSPLEDVAWFCVRDWRFNKIDAPAGGLTDRTTFYAAYAAASGRSVDPADVHFWEIMGNLRWAAGALEQGQRYLSGEKSDLELLAIARRASEMELEALRLCRVGPPAL